MRKREEIEQANISKFAINEKVIESTHTRPGETLILEVLLDIRDLLIENNKIEITGTSNH